MTKSCVLLVRSEAFRKGIIQINTTPDAKSAPTGGTTGGGGKPWPPHLKKKILILYPENLFSCYDL